MRFSGLSRCLFVGLVLSVGCSNPYKHLVGEKADGASVLAYQPRFEKALYRCLVDGRFLFRKFHLSGILLLKKLDDGSTRILFQNEMGLSFFDFEWSRDDSFQVKSVIAQLDKPAVIQVLQKDFELLLMKRLDKGSQVFYRKNDATIFRYALPNGFANYWVENGRLEKIETVGKSVVTSLELNGATAANTLPDSIQIVHHKAHFTIFLTKIETTHDE